MHPSLCLNGTWTFGYIELVHFKANKSEKHGTSTWPSWNVFACSHIFSLTMFNDIPAFPCLTPHSLTYSESPSKPLLFNCLRSACIATSSIPMSLAWASQESPTAACNIKFFPTCYNLGHFGSHLYLIAKILHYRAWCMYEHSKRLDWLRTRWRRIYSIKGILSCCESQCSFSHLNAYNLWNPICMMPSSHWMLVLGPHLVDSSSCAFATHDAVNEFFQSDLRTRTEADDGGNDAMTNDVNQRPKPRYSTHTQKLPKNLMNWITLSCTWLCIWHCRNTLWKRCNKNMQHDSWFQTRPNGVWLRNVFPRDVRTVNKRNRQNIL